nr:YtxH domain-containing protein [uncultured Bacillus sp.]
MNGKHFLLGFFIGSIALGAGTLLAAPASGKETRQTVKEQSMIWLKRLSAVKADLQDLSKNVKNASIESTATIKGFIEDLKTTVMDWKKEIEPHQEKIIQELKALELSIETLENQLKKQ